MFKRDSSKKDAAAQQSGDNQATKGTPKKGHATPTRKQAEAAVRQPLIGGDRKQSKEIDRKRRAEAFERERVALQTGDERYLPVRDKGRIRRFTRNWVDARWSLSEFVLPVMILFLAFTLLVNFIRPDWGNGSWAVMGLTIALYGFFFLSMLEGIIVWNGIKKKVAVAYPNDDIPKGSWFYCWSRMIMARRWRSPKPQVARGQFPEVRDRSH